MRLLDGNVGDVSPVERCDAMVNKTGVAVRRPLRSLDLTGRVGLVDVVWMESVVLGGLGLYFLWWICRCRTK